MDMGIIGGADGPTAIYISSSISPYAVAVSVVLGVIVIGIIIRKVRKGR
mgnify:CR=1 FL=1